MTNEELVSKIRSGDDPRECMGLLCDQMRKLVLYFVGKYRMTRSEEDLQDMEQEGYLALYDAVDGFDPRAGVAFSTYAGIWIKGRLRRYIKENGSCVRLPSYYYERIQKYKRFCDSYRMKNGCEPSDSVVCEFLGLTMEQVCDIRENIKLPHIASLDAPISDAKGGEVGELGEIIPSTVDIESAILDQYDAELLQAILWGLVDALPERQRDAIRMRYLEDKSLKEIGEALGTTSCTASQYEQKGLMELRKPRIANKLRPFFPETEEIRSHAMNGTGAKTFRRSWTSSTERVALKL